MTSHPPEPPAQGPPPRKGRLTRRVRRPAPLPEERPAGPVQPHLGDQSANGNRDGAHPASGVPLPLADYQVADYPAADYPGPGYPPGTGYGPQAGRPPGPGYGDYPATPGHLDQPGYPGPFGGPDPSGGPDLPGYPRDAYPADGYLPTPDYPSMPDYPPPRAYPPARDHTPTPNYPPGRGHPPARDYPPTPDYPPGRGYRPEPAYWAGRPTGPPWDSSPATGHPPDGNQQDGYPADGPPWTEGAHDGHPHASPPWAEEKHDGHPHASPPWAEEKHDGHPHGGPPWAEAEHGGHPAGGPPAPGAPAPDVPVLSVPVAGVPAAGLPAAGGWAQEGAPASHEEYGDPVTTGSRGAHWAMIGYLTVPFFGFLVPLAVFLLSFRGSRWLRGHAAQAINVWLTAVLYALSAVIIGAVLTLDSPRVALTVVVPLVAMLWLITLTFLVRAAAAASRGEAYTFPRWLCTPMVRLGRESPGPSGGSRDPAPRDPAPRDPARASGRGRRRRPAGGPGA